MYVNEGANSGSEKLWTKNTATLNMYTLDSEIQNYVAWWLEDRRRIEDKQKQQHLCYTGLWRGDISVQERDGKMKTRRDPTLWKKW